MISIISAIEVGAIICAIIFGGIAAVNRICKSLDQVGSGIAELKDSVHKISDRIDSIEHAVRDLYSKHSELILHLKNGVK